MSPSFASFRSIVFPCNFAIPFLLISIAPFLSAQHHSSARSTPGISQNTTVDDAPITIISDQGITRRFPTPNEYACFLPPLNSVGQGTIGVVDLRVPQKAKSEYQNGCAALRKNKTGDAERHLRKAVLQYEKYAAAWVLLGQLLEIEHKPDEARDACSKSLNASATYQAGYLCLTDISTRQKRWDDALTFSARSLELDPTTNALAYAYNATANLNLHRLLEAEKSALKALEIDVRNTEPRIHFLLAQIYAAKGDAAGTAAQLREYLKFARDPDDIAMVNRTLAKIDGSATK